MEEEKEEEGAVKLTPSLQIHQDDEDYADDNFSGLSNKVMTANQDEVSRQDDERSSLVNDEDEDDDDLLADVDAQEMRKINFELGNSEIQRKQLTPRHNESANNFFLNKSLGSLSPFKLQK